MLIRANHRLCSIAKVPDTEVRGRSVGSTVQAPGALSHWPRLGDFKRIWFGDERPKALIVRRADCERPTLSTNKTNERDGVDGCAGRPAGGKR